MVKKVLIGGAVGLVALSAILVAVIAAQPSTFHIERSVEVDAPAADVFVHVNNLQKLNDWSPWMAMDPNAKQSYEGPSEGEGAVFRWAGNENIGEGSMTIVESKPHELVRIKLHFLKPFEDTAETKLTLQPKGEEQTQVTWSMDGRNNFIAKAICLFLMDMESMIGEKYEEGLANLKKIAETREAPAASEAFENAKTDR